MYEHHIFTDDAEMLADLIRREWALGPGKEPSIAHDPKQVATSARYASIFVYLLNRSNRIASTDYRTLERTAYLGIRVDASIRDNFLEVLQEIYRIIAANRRGGKRRLGGYTFMELTSERFANDLQGFYSCTLDVRVESFNTPIYSAGFDERTNRRIEDAMYEHSDTDREFGDI